MLQAQPLRSRILVVDDDPFIIDLLQEFLRREHEVFIATSGEEAIAFCRDHLPDLVLLDVTMPGQDGYEVCRMLKSDATTRDVPVIFVTAHDEVEAEVKGLEVGAVDFISKPVHRAVVLARVRTHLVLKEQLEKLRNMAMTDVLTGVANRRCVEAKLEAEWRRCQRNEAPLAVIMIDIDEFKLYNDAYGHHSGDKCLQHIASVLGNGFRRAGDLVGRYGGDEFICVLPETGLDGAIERADALGRAVKELGIVHAHGAARPVMTISRGVCATIPDSETELVILLEVADAMLYEAKRNGCNCTMSRPLG